jgi:putative tricarboxylic transport membrane protein
VHSDPLPRSVLQLLRRYKVQLLRGGFLGTLVGAIPGMGADIAAWLSYAIAKRFSREPQKFGKGSFEPIVDAGTANNAALAAAWIPAIVFGIPGDPVTAIVIGVLMMKGLQPGPLLFQQQETLLNALRAMFILANLLMLPLGYLAIRLAASLLRIPRNILMPVILLLCAVGAYALENNPFDIGIMLVMGVVGYLMQSHGFPLAPAVLGLVLGPLIEENFMISMTKAQGHFGEFFSRPVSLLLAAFTLVVWSLPLLASVVRRAPRQPSDATG